ncbi:MAG: signal recognition particle-docking protein FtsY [Clostridia bacterium]
MLFSKLKENLKKTKEAFDIKLSNVFTSSKTIDEIIDEIEEILILSDIGYLTSSKICDNIRKKLKMQIDKDENAIVGLLKSEMKDILSSVECDQNFDNKVILVVGVNGVGKTTSIAKIANLYIKQGKRVLLVAADTFRAGAVEQLKIWSDRIGADICVGNENQDPASVVFDAVKKYKYENYDILICDTAGRLHNKKNLMDELEKMKKILEKNLPDIEKEIMMILDATTGQNGALQAKAFYEKTNVDSIIVTKLDSTAKGGVIFSIVSDLGIPIKYIGVGENIDDIEIFNKDEFVEAVVGK